MRVRSGRLPTASGTAAQAGSVAAFDQEKPAFPVKGDPCELIVGPFDAETLLETQVARLMHQTTANAAFIRLQNKIFYFNKTTGVSAEASETDLKALHLFDLQFRILPSQQPKTAKQWPFLPPQRFLTDRELLAIQLFWGLSHKKQPAPAPVSQWQTENGVDLIVVDQDPAKLDLDSLPYTNAAYLRYRGQLWYAKRQNPLEHLLSQMWLCKKLGWFQERVLLDKIKGRALERFDAGLNTAETSYQHLSDGQIATIGLLTGHTHRTYWQKFLHALGTFSVGFIALGCGISTAAAFIGLNIATGGLATVIAAALFLAGTAVNWWIFKRYVSTTLIDLFGRENFLVDETGKELSAPKKIAMGLAVACALSVGVTFAGLTYVSTFALPAAFAFLGAVSAALPPVAAVLAGVTLICMTAMMLKDIADLIKKKDIKGTVRNFLKNMVSTDPTLPQNKGKSPGRIVGERVTTVVLTAIFIPLACLGLYMTMNACAPGVKAILINKIPAAAETIAKVISLGFAFIGQIPFGIQTAFQTIGKAVPAFFQAIVDLFGKKQKLSAEEADREARRTVQHGETAPQKDSSAWKTIKLLSVAVNAFGNGLISMVGAVGAGWRWLSLFSGTANSAFAGVPAVLNYPDLPLVPGPSVSQDDIHLRRRTTAAVTLESLRQPESRSGGVADSKAAAASPRRESVQSPGSPHSPGPSFGEAQAVELQPLPTQRRSRPPELKHDPRTQPAAAQLFPRAPAQPCAVEAAKMARKAYDDMAVNYHRRPSIAT